MFEIGRLCVKLLGRDAGKRCVVIDIIDSSFVMIDGETRRRKCNVKHLEPLDKTVQISKGALRAEIIRVFKDMGIELAEKAEPKAKGKKAERPKKARKKKEKPVKAEKPKAKENKKKTQEKKPASEEKEE